MRKMFLLYGFLTYAVVFMLWSLLASYGLAYGWGAQLTSYVVTAAAVSVAARAIGLLSASSALLYGIGWVIMHALLDLLYVAPAAGFEALLTSYVWIEYTVVLATPVGTYIALKYLNKPASVAT
ncbi:MAG: hypothetical protein U1D26_01410 [Patescibacteria group bacterium]|nr:hypothetical protein [bacterium]MDZ4227115.1 hypothetical protein [Patescibacteria group bacterium]